MKPLHIVRIVSKDIMTEFISQTLHVIRIEHQKAGRSGNPSFFSGMTWSAHTVENSDGFYNASYTWYKCLATTEHKIVCFL